MLRLAGLVAIGLSALAGLGLEYLTAASAPHPATVSEFLLAAISFLCASAGAALLVCGPKLLEPQRVSARWHPYA